jgi:2-C-methyl-D-erythritol 4-phosphate cytidylyltransferase
MKTRIDMLREIVAEKQGKRIRVDGRKLYVDLFTASMLVQVYDALNEENRARFIGLPFLRMVDIGWKLTRAAE